MKKILLPVEETTRSLMALAELKANFSPDNYEVILLMVDERVDYSVARNVSSLALSNLEEKLNLVAAAIDKFKVTKRAELGKPGPKICQTARELNVDLILMTKSSKEDMVSAIGATAEYVIIHSPANVYIVEEDKVGGEEYRGLVYRKASAVVNLWGILSLKQSECMLPSVSSDCIYHIEVTRGRVRFVHRSFNTGTMRWDIAPLSGQDEFYYISAGESIDIHVKAYSVDGKADRITVSNRSTKEEAVFTYTITADKGENEQ